jgi:hypothetical protein
VQLRLKGHCAYSIGCIFDQFTKISQIIANGLPDNFEVHIEITVGHCVSDHGVQPAERRQDCGSGAFGSRSSPPNMRRLEKDTLLAYTKLMQATFVELPPFERMRKDYLDDEAYRLLQLELMSNPTAGAVIEGTGGLRKLRQADLRRGKGKRGGLRVIYYWWLGGDQFWLFTVYDKDQADDLAPAQRKVLKQMLKTELESCQSMEGKCDD